MNNTYLRAQQLRKKDAKFPFVKIGTQYWTLKNHDLSVTPQGAVIQEMQADANVEKAVNGGFDTDTAWTKGTGWGISGGSANINGINTSNSDIYQTNAFKIGKYYKISLNVISISSGSFSIYAGNAYNITAGSGLKTIYIKPTSTTMVVFAIAGTVGSIDNVSIQEIGWAGSQELYDGIYAQTSGTVEQKTYAAVKAAAMWCNYNNDAPTGLIYGKLYNWFAVKLFQMDIDYYNAAHPTTPYGWRVPTQAEFQTLSTYLGGDAVSGGKLKEIGLTHWIYPNISADNLTGFTSIGSGKRLEDGTFSNIGVEGIYWIISENGLLANRLYTVNSSSSVDYIQTSKKRGYSIRLIKA